MTPKRRLRDVLKARPNTSGSTSIESLKIRQKESEADQRSITPLNKVKREVPGDVGYGMPFTDQPHQRAPGTKDRMPGNKYGPLTKKRKGKDWI